LQFFKHFTFPTTVAVLMQLYNMSFNCSACILKQNLMLMIRYSTRGTHNMCTDEDFQISCVKLMVSYCDKAGKAAQGLASSTPAKSSTKEKQSKKQSKKGVAKESSRIEV
jgi:hypothetical protein